MATRRPASSRARYNNDTNPIPPPQQRPRSVMAKPIASSSTSSSKTGEDLERSNGTHALQKPRTHGDGETHIQVILRCRGRSERETQENSPTIVQIDGAKTKDVTIETSAPVSSLGMVTLPPTRTYPFDLVFGPEATQSMIYHDVVGPMLEEVLMGYNCTLFAYGQTGTGKTYTMQGDLSPTPMGNPSPHAGIIPRVLFRLFHELEKSYTDFVVKVSFIELYNEELRDLLGNDLQAPTSLTQPMGMAAKDAKAVDGGLKIFDEANKRGVVIQGLEEIAVKDSKHALAMLTKGSERRQIAATRFNDHSSRSHSVFSITVHLKEKTNMGDDLLKVGKLNLVDLAGSENIGRSGAENKRAREAGMINQSLLTLGRVINALVDKAQHVPYRESKLTRLLQDSLGGRTKTCIIATVSPARSNLEETLSTLDYALRAKSIRNKPELNQRMTRNSLLKEYVAEIDRLKADLLAAREKNGIYFSEETWNEMNAENELRQTELVEAKKQVTIIENQLRNVRDEFDQSIALLKRKEEELQSTRADLQQKQEMLRQREVELQQATNSLEEEVVVRQAHQDTEVAMNEVAVGLKNVAVQSLHDMNGLFEKLDRKGKVLQSNKKVVLDNQKVIHSGTNALMQKLAEMSQSSRTLRASLKRETEQFQVAEQKAQVGYTQQADATFSAVQTLLQEIEKHQGVEDGSLAKLKQEIQSSTSASKTKISSWSKELHIACTRLSKESTDSAVKQVTLLEQSISILYTLVGSACGEVQGYLKDERDSLTQAHELAKSMASKEISHLTQQNEVLARMLVEERKHGERAKADLLNRVSGLIGDFLEKRDESLRESVGNLQESNKEVEELVASTYKRQSEAHDDTMGRNDKMNHRVQDVQDQSAKAKDGAVQVAWKTREVVETGMQHMQETVISSVATYSRWAQSKSKETGDICDRAFDEHSRAKRARIEATNTVRVNTEHLHHAGQSSVASSSKRTGAYTTKSLSSIQERERAATEYEGFAVDNLESIEQAANNLSSKGSKDDVPTGSTPKKRKWQYTDEWSLTRGRDELLNSWRQQKSGAQDVEMQDETEVKTADIENEPPAVEMQPAMTKVEVAKEFSAEPLVESRRRNISTTRAPRRAR